MTSQPSKCCNGGKCCSGEDEIAGLNRRDFIKSAALVAGGVGIYGSQTSQAEAAAPNPELEAWMRTLWERGERRVYRGAALKNIAMPMGGIGAGQVYLRGNGELGPWQIVNNFNSNAFAPGSFFAIRTTTESGSPVARLLQEGGLDAIPGVASVAFSGEYPLAWITYSDPEIPVSIELECSSPFCPLNTKDSALPAVTFRFTVRNNSERRIDVSLVGAMPNLVGWNGYAALPKGSYEYAEYANNENRVLRESKATIVDMRTRSGSGNRLAEGRELYTNNPEVAHQLRLCQNLSVHVGDPVHIESEGKPSVYWLGNSSPRDDAKQVRNVLDAVKEGAALVISGDYASLIGQLPDKKQDASAIEIFEDWNSGTYGAWAIQGDAFGAAPATGTLPGQQPVSGFKGSHLINTFVGGDASTGKATSKAFAISKHFIHLLVGGGNHAGETCVNLRIDGEIVATATGQNSESLLPVVWNVGRYKGKSAQLEIVDSHSGGWGHVLVSTISFSDSPLSPFVSKELADAIRDALPITWKKKEFVESPVEIGRDSMLCAGIAAEHPMTRGHWTFTGIKKRKQAKVLLSTTDDAPLIVSGAYGKGRVIVCLGAAERWLESYDRKTLIGNIVGAATDLAYESQNGWSKESAHYGSMSLSVLDANATSCAQWDDMAALWKTYTKTGRLESEASPGQPSAPGRTWNSALCSSMVLNPSESKECTFVLTWHFPNRMRDAHYWWKLEQGRYDFRLGNKYNTWFEDATAVARYVIDNAERLQTETRLFHETFYDSTLPRYFLDAVTANASITRSPIYIWLEDGAVGGFEGSDACCPLNCTHVYNYAMSTAYLFPDLERKIREMDILIQMHPTEHYIPHRTVVPLSEPRLEKYIGGPEHPALDGELGTILKTHREWRLHGDKTWLDTLWPKIKLLMQYVMREHDPNGDGIIRGEQPNTYDTHLYGSNTFIGTLYLAALRTCEELAALMGDADFAALCKGVFEKGKAAYDVTCWNGEYYANVFDAPNVDADIYNRNNCYGPGCFSDQLLGQWWAHLLDLGYLLPEDHVKKTLAATFRYNWRFDLSDHKHDQRVFAEGKEKGLLTGTWPKGGRPEKPILYCDEVWTGLEYHVAATLICEGMLDEGMAIVKGARERYTGNQRNPWSEIECGGHYARAMSSYSLLTVVSGFAYDAGARRVSLAPRITPNQFMSFFSAGTCWGSIEQDRFSRSQRNIIFPRYGSLNIESIEIELPDAVDSGVQVAVDVAGLQIPLTLSTNEDRCSLRFVEPLAVSAGQPLIIRSQWT